MSERVEQKIPLQLSDLTSMAGATMADLRQLHYHLYHQEDPDAGFVRTAQLVDRGRRYVSTLYLNEALRAIDRMPSQTVEQIVDKGIEVYAASPFRHHNLRVAAVWLELAIHNVSGRWPGLTRLGWNRLESMLWDGQINPRPLYDAVNQSLSGYTQEWDDEVMDVAEDVAEYRKCAVNVDVDGVAEDIAAELLRDSIVRFNPNTFDFVAIVEDDDPYLSARLNPKFDKAVYCVEIKPLNDDEKCELLRHYTSTLAAGSRERRMLGAMKDVPAYMRMLDRLNLRRDYVSFAMKRLAERVKDELRGI